MTADQARGDLPAEVPSQRGLEAAAPGPGDPPDPLERELRRMALLHRRDVVARRRGGARALARWSA